MSQEIDELTVLLSKAYSQIPESRKGLTKIIDYDPAGNTYEFIEHEWSVRIRKILGIRYEPTGI